jgi:hypothetical protein
MLIPILHPPDELRGQSFCDGATVFSDVRPLVAGRDIPFLGKAQITIDCVTGRSPNLISGEGHSDRARLNVDHCSLDGHCARLPAQPLQPDADELCVAALMSPKPVDPPNVFALTSQHSKAVKAVQTSDKIAGLVSVVECVC